MYVVYGLEDQRNHEVFYVGITDDIHARFLQHLRCDGSNPVKDARIIDMRVAGYLPLPRSLQIVADVQTAKMREAYWMRHYHDMGILLTNQVMPVHHEHIVIHPERVEPVKPRLKARMTLDEQREYILYLLDQGLPRRKILAKIDGYIHSRIANGIIDEITMQPLTASVGSAIKEVARASLTIKDVPEMIRKEIEEAYARHGFRNRVAIRDELQLNGDQYWMVRNVCDEYDRKRKEG